MYVCFYFFFFSSRRRHTRCALVTGVQTCALPISWGDGTPVTTKDVLFTWKVGRHPTAGAGNLELNKRIHKIDVIDDKTFVIQADRISFEYAAITDFRLLPAHIEETSSAADPAAHTTIVIA